MLSVFWRRKPCPSCELYGTQVMCLEEINRKLEIRAVKAETKVELLEMHLAKLEPLTASLLLKPQGGFVPMELPEQEPESTGPTLQARIDEVFGTGISLSEFEAREQIRRRTEREALEAERAKVDAELLQIR